MRPGMYGAPFHRRAQRAYVCTRVIFASIDQLHTSSLGMRNAYLSRRSD